MKFSKGLFYEFLGTWIESLQQEHTAPEGSVK